MRPEKTPVETLAKAIAQQLRQAAEWRKWHQTLSSAVALDHIQELLKDLRAGDARTATILLPIDQCEELFTVASSQERAAFLHLLVSALDPAHGLPLMVIAAGRSDVLEGLLEAGELAHLTETYPLVPMPLDQVPRLIEGPAAVASLNVDKGLSEIIARDVESSGGFHCSRTHCGCSIGRSNESKKLSIAEYRSLGDPERNLNPIQNSVRLTADQAIGGLKPSEVDSPRCAMPLYHISCASGSMMASGCGSRRGFRNYHEIPAPGSRLGRGTAAHHASNGRSYASSGCGRCHDRGHA